jgi:ubiquinone/menaquinone biosynthesis C-methylase UbiE
LNRGTALFLAVVIALSVSCGAAQSPATATRKPAPVMTWEGADWLTRNERIQEEDPDRMLAALNIQPGMVVADVGAGVGYHTWRMSTMVGPTGKILAEDIQPEMLRMLKKNIDDRKLKNVEIVQGTPTDPKLPEGRVDLILMVDVYHEISDPAVMMAKIRKSLKPGGRLVLVEFRGEDPKVPIQPAHKMTVAQVRSELEPMGFTFQQSLEFLPWQHIIILGR